MDSVQHHLQALPADVDELRDLLTGGAELTEIEAEAARQRSSLARDFGERFNDFDTDWSEVQAALLWAKDVLEFLPSDPSERCLGHIEDPEDLAAYRQRAGSVAAAVEAFLAELAKIEERFDAGLTQWGRWKSGSFHDLEEWAKDLSTHAQSASNWIEYRIAVRELDERLGVDVVSQIRAVTDRAELVPKVVRRQVIGAWLDAVWQHEPALRDFARQDHDDLRAQFEELDRALAKAAISWIRDRCFSSYPDRSTAGIKAGQLGTLRGELSKRRRQLSVRKLILRIPNLLQNLKPVFLMSPLAASKFLPRDELGENEISFDAVIFDEASQVFPEDAIPAIARGTRTIVVGDQKQLPPTNFFRRSLGDDEYDDNAESDAFEGRESILDAMVGMVGRNVAESYLGMHYRSRHDSLIRFSNHYFYSDRLLIFPSPDADVSGDGICDIFLRDARYDPHGGQQDGSINRGEAERAVDEVFRLMRSRPGDESVGVVTLNRAQADLIMDLVNSRRLDERDVDEWFSEDRREPFFVKNLEPVQGDERDHITLSIVYGPTVGSGQVPNRFGPINREGGERRLNVAVTRARRSMTLIHSLRPTDIHVDTQGPLLLRRYLEYAADPVRAFESKISTDPAAATESPFEDAVEAAIRGRGYRVDRQVGVSGYRIDLAILSEDGTKFDLGIECDGATYHRAPAARDRDWLRQNVLEGLGWTIHRVWSTSWIRNPESGLDAILNALSKARAKEQSQYRDTTDESVETQESSVEAATTSATQIIEAPAAMDSRLLFEEYGASSLSDIRVSRHPENDSWETIEELILRVAEAEAPVHRDVILQRLRSRYGLGRAGRLVRKPIDSAINLSVRREKLAWLEPDFIVVGNEPGVIEPRRPKLDEQPRKIEYISITELKAGLLRILHAVYGSERDDLITEVARQFGYSRTGVEISSRLDRAITELLEGGDVVRTGEMLSLSRT